MFRRALKHVVQPLRQQLQQQLTESSTGQQLSKRHGSLFGSAYRQLFSSAESSQGGGGSSKPKSMLDAAEAWGGSSALGGAAAKVRAMAPADAGAQGEGAAGGSAQKAASSIAGRIFDFLLYGSLAAAATGAVCYSKYSIQEVEEALKSAEQQQQQEPSVLTQAWIQVLRNYLSTVVSLDSKVIRRLGAWGLGLQGSGFRVLGLRSSETASIPLVMLSRRLLCAHPLWRCTKVHAQSMLWLALGPEGGVWEGRSCSAVLQIWCMAGTLHC
jgi:hypothetical protein